MLPANVLSPYENHNVIEGIENRRSSAAAAVGIDKDTMPENFPLEQWHEQSARYEDYWSWFTGVRLASDTGRTRDGKTVSKFPLQINTVRNFSRKHNALLWGEIPDTPQPVVRTVVRPKKRISGSEIPETEKKSARSYENICNEVWEQSNGNAIMLENGLMSQFLGGCYFQLKYVKPYRPDLRIPIVVNKIVPDFVLPIWSNDNDFVLNEAWIVYRISKASAERDYGIHVEGNWAVYVEHWTREQYTIYIDNKPLVATHPLPFGGSVTVSYDHTENPFKFVPIFYVPRFREGSFYGSSLVPDIAALSLEYNGRLADLGTIVKRTADRKWFGRNISGNIAVKQLDTGTWYSDLGMQNPSINNPPEVWAENPANLSDTFVNNNENLWEQLMIEGSLTKVAFGYVDGTQRSGETLKALMWPSAAAAKNQRVNWSAGKNQIDKHILAMCFIKQIKIDGIEIPQYVWRDFDVRQDWLPILPKDREQTVNEVVSLTGVNRISLEQSILKLGDVEDVQEEIDRIEEEQEKAQENQMALKTPQPNENKPSGD